MYYLHIYIYIYALYHIYIYINIYIYIYTSASRMTRAFTARCGMEKGGKKKGKKNVGEDTPPPQRRETRADMREHPKGKIK